MSKPGADPTSGISLGDALRLPKRHPACRRREAQPGSCMERVGASEGALWCQKPTYAPQQILSSLDHLIGGGEQRRRHSKAEDAGRFGVATSWNFVACM